MTKTENCENENNTENNNRQRTDVMCKQQLRMTVINYLNHQ